MLQSVARSDSPLLTELKNRGYTIVISGRDGIPNEGWPNGFYPGMYSMFAIWKDLHDTGAAGHRQFEIREHGDEVRFTISDTPAISEMARNALFSGSELAGKVHIPAFEFNIDQFDPENEVTVHHLCDQIDLMWFKDPVVSDDPVEGYMRVGDTLNVKRGEPEWKRVDL